MLANRKTVEKSLASALGQIEQGWDDWMTNEVAGRCLRALGRPDEAETYLRKVLRLRPDPTEHYQWLAVGAVHRLLGEDAQAQESWRRAVEAIEAAGRPEIDLGRLSEALFLSGRDQEALALARDLEGNRLTRAGGVQLLAEARQRGDGELAAQAADWFTDRIRREREKVSATGMVNLHDWHEIATEVEQELGSSA